MAVTTTELANFVNAAFFDNRTWLNQENWQNFFGGALPSGVIVEGGLQADGQYYSNALALQAVNSSYKAFRPGKIIANGIYAEYNASTNIPVVTSSQVDRLIVARVYLQSGEVKIVGKTKIAQDAGYTTQVFAGMLLQDESLGCDRDDVYYDIPLVYEIYGGNSYDLRRLYYLPTPQSPFLTIPYSYADATSITDGAGVLYGKGYVNVFGGTAYDIEIAEGDMSTSLLINPQPACSEKPIIVSIVNNSSVTKEIRLPLGYKGLTLSYEWIDNWDVQSGQNAYRYRDLVATDKMVLCLTPYKSDTSFGFTVASKGMTEGIDPDDYFTKVQTAALLAEKADTDDVEAALALKANAADLGALATQNTADYVTQLTNKPTLGSLASKNSVNLSSEATGILPVANGGTGSSSLDEIISMIIGEGKTYYVNSATGSDDNDGSSTTPFKTIQKAIDTCGYATKFTIVIASGSYTENLTIPRGKNIVWRSPNSSSPNVVNITITAANNNAPALTIDGGVLELAYNFRTSPYYNAAYFFYSANAEAAVKVTNGGKLYQTNARDNSVVTTTNSYSSTVNNSASLLVDKGSTVSIHKAACYSTGGNPGVGVSAENASVCSFSDITVSGAYGLYVLSSIIMYGALHSSATYNLQESGGQIFTGTH
jgi:hypothetical protein